MENRLIATLDPEGSTDNIQIPSKRGNLIRPRINYLKALLNVFIPLFICFFVCFWDLRFSIAELFIYLIIRLRGILIWFVRVYQRYAPDDIRLSCVFEPSCSEYMILSIKKYGAIRGCIKGIKRLKRCSLPGGIDYP